MCIRDRATAVLHYAQEIFEGLKAYRRDDGGVNLFRPDANARRFLNSAQRMAMAPLPEPVFVEAVEQLVRIDRDWIPGGEGSLYLRPFMIANEVFLGVKPSAEYIFAVIASPVGSYFKGGPAPVSIWVSENYTLSLIHISSRRGADQSEAGVERTHRTGFNRLGSLSGIRCV